MLMFKEDTPSSEDWCRQVKGWSLLCFPRLWFSFHWIFRFGYFERLLSFCMLDITWQHASYCLNSFWNFSTVFLCSPFFCALRSSSMFWSIPGARRRKADPKKRNATSGGQMLPEMVVMRDPKRDVVVTMMQRKGTMMLWWFHHTGRPLAAAAQPEIPWPCSQVTVTEIAPVEPSPAMVTELIDAPPTNTPEDMTD